MGGIQQDGAQLASSDHPVVRIHAARDRLIESDAFARIGGRYAVNPRLLAHPLLLLALAWLHAEPLLYLY